ncbi:MAG: hypothetical protein M3309_01375 [Actinomycetota bacterium]|nr:hypothetical protein [Actinomycetota bacterium]
MTSFAGSLGKPKISNPKRAVAVDEFASVRARHVWTPQFELDGAANSVVAIFRLTSDGKITKHSEVSYQVLESTTSGYDMIS